VIERLKPGAAAAGDVVDMDGKVLGRHDGIIHFTIGQRRGFEDRRSRTALRGGARRREAARRVGPREALTMRRIALRDVNWIGEGALDRVLDAGRIEVSSRSLDPAPRAAFLSATDPVDVAQGDPPHRQRPRAARHDALLLGVERHHVKRCGTGDLQAAPLADGEMDDAVVAAQHLAVHIDDVAGRRGAGLQSLDHVGVAAGRYKADVLAVVLVGDRKPELAGELSRLGLAEIAERKPQEIELRVGGAEQEVALVALFFLAR